MKNKNKDMGDFLGKKLIGLVEDYNNYAIILRFEDNSSVEISIDKYHDDAYLKFEYS